MEGFFEANKVDLLIVMVAYITFLVLWGIYQGRKVKTEEDFSIGGRRLPGWVAALSERATGESSWALLGLPGAAYAMGVMEVWTAVGCVLGIIVSWAILAWRLRNEAEKYQVSTFTDYIAKRNSDLEKYVRVISSLTIVFFFFFYVGAQFLGGGKILFTMFGIKQEISMLITAAIIIPYTIYGGFRSVVYTDVIQAIVMIITLVVGPIVGIYYISVNDGLYANSMFEALNKAGESYTSFFGMGEGFVSGIIILSGFSWFFGYLGGQPQLTTRFMAINDFKQAKKARNIGILWTLFAYLGALSLGWIGIAIFGPSGLTDREYVMPSVLLTIFSPYVAALLITGAIAAMISTADSLLILSATELYENIIKRKKKKALNNNSDLFYSRVVTAIIALVALFVAFVSPSNLIFTLVSYVWAGIGGTFSVVILLSLFWKRFNGKSAIVTIAVGMLFTIIWISTGMEEVITSRILTFFVALIVAIVSTLIFYPKSRKNLNYGN